MKRKIIPAVIAAILLISSPVAAFAEETAYYSDDLGLSVEIPDFLVTTTRDTPADDPVFYEYGLDRDVLTDYFNDNACYLYAFSTSGKVTVCVYMRETDSVDFAEYRDVDFESFINGYVKGCEEQNISVSHHEKYGHPQTPFMKLHSYYGNSSEYGMTYTTVYDGRLYTFTAYSYDHFSDYLDGVFSDMIDSIVFNAKADKGIASNKSVLWLVIASVAVVPAFIVIWFSHKKANGEKVDEPVKKDPVDPNGGGEQL